MTQIESNVNQERTLARTLIELSNVFTRTRLMLPSASIQEILLLAGAVEQAKSEGLSIRKGRPVGSKNKPAVEVVAGGPVRVKALSPSPEKGFPQLVGIKKVRLKVTINKKPVPVLEALCLFLTEQKEPQTVRQVVEGFEARGWKINSASKKPLAAAFRLILNRHTNVFKSVAKEGAVLYSMKNQAPAKSTKRTRDRFTKESQRVREAVIATITTYGKPISTPDLAKKMNIDNAQRLSTLMVSLHNRGTLQKSSKNGAILWTLNKDAAKMLNGAAPVQQAV